MKKEGTRCFSLLVLSLAFLAAGCRKEGADRTDTICGKHIHQTRGARLVAGDPGPRVQVFGFPASFMLDNLESEKAVSCTFSLFGPQVAPDRVFTRFGSAERSRLKITAPGKGELRIEYPLASKSYGIVSIEKPLSLPADARHVSVDGLKIDIEGGVFLRSEAGVVRLRALGPAMLARVSNHTQKKLELDIVLDNVSDRMSSYSIGGQAGPGDYSARRIDRLRVHLAGKLAAGERLRLKVVPRKLDYPYSFVFGGDIKEHIATFLALLDKVRKKGKPLFMLGIGDYTRNSLPAELDDFFKACQRIDFPVYYVKGNHESRCQGDAHYRRRFGPECYFMVIDRMLFVVLDSTRRDKQGYHLDDGQLGWLKEVLNNQQALPWKFILLHTPPDPLHGDTLHPDHNSNLAATDAAALKKIAIEHGVSYVLSGHAHLYARREEHGVVYLTSGGGGARLYTYNPVVGYDIDTRPHLMLFTVYPDAIEEQAVRLQSR